MKDEEKQPDNESSKRVETSDIENSRRKLINKFAAGAFAIPAVLASISAQAVPRGSFLN